MKKISIATIQGKWSGDFESNATWYREQALSLKGKNLAIVGFKNKLTIFASKLAPRSFVTKTSAKTMKKEQ